MSSHYYIIRDQNTGEGLNIGVHEGEFIDVGDMSRESLDYLGEWKVFMNKRGYGLAHRIGIKKGFADKAGDPKEFYLHFALPIAKRGHDLTDDERKEVHESLKKVMQTSTLIWSKYHPNISLVSVEVSPPDYMIKDLEELLS